MPYSDTIRCKRRDCFGCVKGKCDFLIEKALNENATCKFYKTRDAYNKELIRCALKLNMSIDEYLKVTGLKLR